MSNTKSIRERFNTIFNKGPERWLSRSLFEEDDHLSRGRSDVEAHRQQQTERQPESQPTAPASLDLSRGNPAQKTAAHSSGNRDSTMANESMSIRAMKNLLIDKMDIDSDDYAQQLRDGYGNHASSKNIHSSIQHAKTAQKLFNSRMNEGQMNDLIPNLRLGRQSGNNDDLGDVASTRYGEKIEHIWRSLSSDQKNEVFNSNQRDSWNPQDVYGIDGRIEDKLISELEELRATHGEDPKSMIHAINHLTREYIGNNQLFPMSLKTVNDGDGGYSEQNVKEIKEGDDSVRAAALSQLRPVNLNLNLSGESMSGGEEQLPDFDSNSLDLLVKLGLQSDYTDGETGADDYFFNYRIQRGAGLNPDQADVRKIYRNEPMPLKRGAPNYGEFTGANKPKAPTLRAPLSVSDDPDSLTPAKRRKDDERRATNAQRQKEYDEKLKKHEDDLKAWEEGRAEAELPANRPFSPDADSKIGMIPNEILREHVSELIGEDDQNKMMGVDSVNYEDPGEYEGPRYPDAGPEPQHVEPRLKAAPRRTRNDTDETWAEKLSNYNDYVDEKREAARTKHEAAMAKWQPKADQAGQPRENNAQYRKYLQAKERFENNEVMSRNFRDFSTEGDDNELDYWHNKLQGLYDYEDAKGEFNIDKSDLKLGNQTYGRDNLRDFLSDMFAIDKETRLPVEQRETIQRLFGRNDFQFTESLQQKVRLMLQRIALTDGFKQHHHDGDLKNIIAKGFLKGSKAKDNLNHPYFKLEKERIMEHLGFLDSIYYFVLQ